MAQKSQINMNENRYKVAKSGPLGSIVEAIVSNNISNRSGHSAVREQFRISSRIAKNDIFFILLSAGNDKGQEGVSVDHILSCNNNYTTRRQLEKCLDEIVKAGLFSYDELSKRYKITKRGLYYLRSYSVTGMDLF